MEPDAWEEFQRMQEINRGRDVAEYKRSMMREVYDDGWDLGNESSAYAQSAISEVNAGYATVRSVSTDASGHGVHFTSVWKEGSVKQSDGSGHYENIGGQKTWVFDENVISSGHWENNTTSSWMGNTARWLDNFSLTSASISTGAIIITLAAPEVAPIAGPSAEIMGGASLTAAIGAFALRIGDYVIYNRGTRNELVMNTFEIGFDFGMARMGSKTANETIQRVTGIETYVIDLLTNDKAAFNPGR